MNDLSPYANGPPLIATPDRRLRVFVSSTLEELATERRAVRAAVTRLRLTPVMFELGARPHPPRDLYRAYLAQSDVFVGVYGDRYGWTAPGTEVSGLEEELRLSTSLPRLLYVRTPAPDRDPRLTALVDQVWSDATTSTKPFATPEELADLVADDLAVLLTERFTADRPAAGLSVPSVPVPPTPLVGRRDELLQVLTLLRRPGVRLVTVVGPGGIGKTRLALEVAAALVDETEGVWFVDLSALRDPHAVAPTVAGALGVHAEGSRPVLDLLAARLAGRRALLVLDNFEHLLPAAADVGLLLGRCPRLQVLVTSRSVLHLRGEHDLPLRPLPLPPPGSDLSATTTSAAVQLLVERARQVRPDFSVTVDNAPAVAEIARRAEGLPLTLELAAARLRLLSPQALLQRLGDRLSLSTSDLDVPERQRTLRAALDWSHDLLAPAEQALLAQLSVCVGGFTLETAEQVGQVDADVLEVLGALVGHSLVTVDEQVAAEPRFRMLEAVRSYAAERLAERGEEPAARRRWSDHLVAVAAQAGAGLAGPENRLWTARVDDEVDDLRAALQLALDDDDAERAVRLTAPLARYWWARGLLREMLAAADRTAGLPSAPRLPADAAALLLWARGAMSIALGRLGTAGPLLERLVQQARDLGDDVLLGHGLTALAMTRPPGPALRPDLEQAVGLFRRAGDTWAVAYALLPLGHLSLLEGDVAGAHARHLEALAAVEAIDDDHLHAQVLDQLGVDAVLVGDADEARRRLTAAAGLHQQLSDQEGLANCLDALAALALLLGDAAQAARLCGASTRTREVVGLAVWPLVEPLHRQLADAVRTVLGDAADARERAAGAALPPQVALDQGLQAVAASPAGAAPR